MAKQVVNIGNSANDGAGDPLRTAFDKINDNFTEVYNELGGNTLSNISMTGNTIQSDDTNGNITVDPNGTGTITLASAVTISGATLTMSNLTVSNSGATFTTGGTNDIDLVPGGGEVNVTGHIVSDTTNTKDLGSATNSWRNTYTTELRNTGDRINIATTLTPASSVGATGDEAGDVAFDGSYIYYCKAAYDGTTDIWNRVAWTDTGAW